MDPKYLHDTRKKLNDLAVSHNRLTTLAACLLNEVQSLKRELNEMKGIKTVQTSSPSMQSATPSNRAPPTGRRPGTASQPSGSNPFRYDASNISNLQADEILKQLHIAN
jgi:hypothetical protein